MVFLGFVDMGRVGWLDGLSGLEGDDPRAVFDLIALVEFRIARGAGVPHSEEDFDPALPEASQRAGVGLALLAVRPVVGLGPGSGVPALVGEMMDGVA